MQIIYETDELKITYDPGTTTRAVVSFTGLGFALGGIQKEEFSRSLRNNQSNNNVYYVIDKKQNWYNANYQTIKECLSVHLAEYQEIITLGNSMGGFGSIFFASCWPACQRAIAFSPQFSLLSSQLKGEESRWKEYRDKIHAFNLCSALDYPSDQVEYFVFFGSDDPMDVLHAHAFKAVAPKRMWILLVKDCGHNVASIIRAHGCLAPLLDAIVNEKCQLYEIRQMFEKFGVAHIIL